jgi:hypothetical protein
VFSRWARQLGQRAGLITWLFSSSSGLHRTVIQSYFDLCAPYRAHYQAVFQEIDVQDSRSRGYRKNEEYPFHQVSAHCGFHTQVGALLLTFH